MLLCLWVWRNKAYWKYDLRYSQEKLLRLGFGAKARKQKFFGWKEIESSNPDISCWKTFAVIFCCFLWCLYLFSIVAWGLAVSFMSVMSVTKRGNQHFYFFSQRAERWLSKLKWEDVTGCDLSFGCSCDGRREITTDTRRLCSRENFSAKELFQTSWRKVFLAACAANWNWNHAR